MSTFDRTDPISLRPKGAFDQILTSWFLDAPAKAILSKHFQHRISWPTLQAKISAGILEHEDKLYLPVFYQGKLPSPDCKEVFLSFRLISNPRWKYGYVLIKEAQAMA